MPVVASGAISFSDIENEFGGQSTTGISISEYYQNANPSYTSGVTGIPNVNAAISIDMFYGKSKPGPPPSVEYMLSGNIGGNMSEAGGSRMGIDNRDDSFAGIGTVFQFFWFGTDWGSSNNIQWTTNNVMTFGGGNTQYQNWSPGTGKGVLMGQYDRQTNFSTQFAPTSSNGYNIKRFIVNQRNYYATAGSEIQMEIRLLRGPAYQYIEIRMAQWTAGTGGIWNISDGGSFYNTFSGAPPVGTGASVVLRGSLTGTNWVAYNNHYMNL
jgi:hypothetical protein